MTDEASVEREAREAALGYSCRDLRYGGPLQHFQQGYLAGHAAALAKSEQMVKVLEAMVPRWVEAHGPECLHLYNDLKWSSWGTKMVNQKQYSLMVPPIPLPVPSPAQNQETEVSCPNCDGSGMIHGSRAEHDPSCDGSCRNRPVEVEVQEPCSTCGKRFRVALGIEEIPLPVEETPPARERSPGLPECCYTPTACAGRTACPKNPACSE